MNYKLIVPGPIEDIEEIRVLEWHGVPGQTFAAGDLIVELETHKAIVEVRAARPGVLRHILCEAGGWRRIGEPMALMSDDPNSPLPETADGLAAMLVEFEII